MSNTATWVNSFYVHVSADIKVKYAFNPAGHAQLNL